VAFSRYDLTRQRHFACHEVLLASRRIRNLDSLQRDLYRTHLCVTYGVAMSGLNSESGWPSVLGRYVLLVCKSHGFDIFLYTEVALEPHSLQSTSHGGANSQAVSLICQILLVSSLFLRSRSVDSPTQPLRTARGVSPRPLYFY
jgi:hypothetical protein